MTIAATAVPPMMTQRRHTGSGRMASGCAGTGCGGTGCGVE